jgi:hypothetical protein
MTTVQRYLAHKTSALCRTVQYPCAQRPMVILGGLDVSYERGTPVPPRATPPQPKEIAPPPLHTTPFLASFLHGASLAFTPSSLVPTPLLQGYLAHKKQPPS